MCSLLQNEPIENLMPLEIARKSWVPKRSTDKPISTATIYRWAKRGCCGVKLEVLYTPDGAVTSRAAVMEFLAAVDKARRGGPPERLQATDEELCAAGLSIGKRGTV